MGESPVTVPELRGLEPIEGVREDGHAFFACNLAAALPGADFWFAYIHNNASPTSAENHFVLHSPEVHPRSLLYCRVETYGARRGRLHISPGAHYTAKEQEVPSFTRERPICREEITVNPERGPGAVAKDVTRRLLPQGEIHWQQADEYAERKVTRWETFLDAVREVCEMGGKPVPDAERMKRGQPFPEQWNVSLHDGWHLELRGLGSYELTKHGDTSDLFDTLDAIGWGPDA